MLLSESLDREAELGLMRLQDSPAARRIVDGRATAAQLARYYVNAHAIVSQATACLAQSRDSLRRQGGSPALVALLDQKVAEERGHDRWLADDLAHIGFPLNAPQTPKPGAASIAYNRFHGPMAECSGEAFLGAAWVLESMAMHAAPSVVSALQRSETIGEVSPASHAGLTFLSGHGEADVQHMQKLRSLVDRHVTGRHARAYVKLSARFVATVYADLF